MTACSCQPFQESPLSIRFVDIPLLRNLRDYQLSQTLATHIVCHSHAVVITIRMSFSFKTLGAKEIVRKGSRRGRNKCSGQGTGGRREAGLREILEVHRRSIIDLRASRTRRKDTSYEVDYDRYPSGFYPFSKHQLSPRKSFVARACPIRVSNPNFAPIPCPSAQLQQRSQAKRPRTPISSCRDPDSDRSHISNRQPPHDRVSMSEMGAKNQLKWGFVCCELRPHDLLSHCFSHPVIMRERQFDHHIHRG